MGFALIQRTITYLVYTVKYAKFVLELIIIFLKLVPFEYEVELYECMTYVTKLVRETKTVGF